MAQTPAPHGKLPIRWNLGTIYGGEAQFVEGLVQLEADIAALNALLEGGSVQGEELLVASTEAVQSNLARLREAESYTSCLVAQDSSDKGALGLSGRVKNIAAALAAAFTLYDEQLMGIAEADWQSWIQRPELDGLGFNLAERRELAAKKLPPAQEALAAELAVDGYHAWGDLYDTVVSRARFAVHKEQGEPEYLSAGQMANRLSLPEREQRAAAFEEWEREWGANAELCAEALNHIAGFRLKLYGKRGWADVLEEPLGMNRMSKQTLSAMWEAIEAGKPALVRYLQRKAELLGVERLDWHDIEAPIGSAAAKVSYEEAAAFILEHFHTFNPAMAAFSRKAFEQGWIEAEDRAGKRPGGFCTSFPVSKETRIFMTFSGTASNVATLAHELGHAYHQEVMDGLPPLAQEYAMNVAETASTFAEIIVADASVRAAQDTGTRIALLEDKIQRSVAFFMNIHARFLFETRMYEARRSGLLTVGQLNAMMEEAQREAFCGMLGKAHPHFWASKLHFYLTDVPFYNFPYTFGYLFSTGLYARALEEGPSFADKYVSLLRDTGRMTVEQLAEQHLGAKLDEREFWDHAVQLACADVEAFLALTEGGPAKQ